MEINDTILAVISYTARNIPVIMPAQDRLDIISSAVTVTLLFSESDRFRYLKKSLEIASLKSPTTKTGR